MNVIGQLTDTGNKDFNSFNYVGVAVYVGGPSQALPEEPHKGNSPKPQRGE